VTLSAKPRPRLLRVEETARALEISTKSVRRLIERGELRVHRIGRCLRLSEEELRRYLNRTCR